MAKKIRTYVGADPNLKWLKCQVISERNEIAEAIFIDDILGKFIRRIHISQLQ